MCLCASHITQLEEIHRFPLGLKIFSNQSTCQDTPLICATRLGRTRGGFKQGLYLYWDSVKVLTVLS